jgi:hypothetical protein
MYKTSKKETQNQMARFIIITIAVCGLTNSLATHTDTMALAQLESQVISLA